MLVTDEKSEVVFPDLSKVANEPAEILLSPIDSVMPNCYIAALYIFKNSDKANDFMPFDLLTKGLKLAMADFPDFCYQLKRNSTGDCVLATQNAGFRLVTAKGDFSAADLEATGFDPVQLPAELLDGSSIDCGQFVTKIKLTRLSDNSVTIGIFLHHCVTDGDGAFSFINRWAGVCRELKLGKEPEGCQVARDRSVLYSDKAATSVDHDEYVYLDPAIPPPEGPRFPISDAPQFTVKMFHFGAEFLRGLKAFVNGRPGGEGVDCTTNDCMVALLWRCVTMAKGLEGPTATKFALACNARGRLSLPAGYAGNANFYVARQLTAAEVAGSSLAELARQVRAAVSRGSSPEHLRSILRWVDAKPDRSRVMPGFRMFGPDLAFTSWVHFPIYAADFGWGKPLRFAIPSKGFDGLAVLLPRWDGDGYEVMLGSTVQVIDKLASMPDFVKPF